MEVYSATDLTHDVKFVNRCTSARSYARNVMLGFLLSSFQAGFLLALYLLFLFPISILYKCKNPKRRVVNPPATSGVRSELGHLRARSSIGSVTKSVGLNRLRHLCCAMALAARK